MALYKKADIILNLKEEVNTTLKPKKREKWLSIIRDIISFIGFIAIFYNPLNEKNENLILETNQEVNHIDKRLLNVEDILQQNTGTINLTNNYKCLKLSEVFIKPDKNSKKIGQIKKGQKIKILEVRRKYCCIAILPENNQDAIVGYILINNTNFNY